jgi:hypothetical protein
LIVPISDRATSITSTTVQMGSRAATMLRNVKMSRTKMTITVASRVIRSLFSNDS